MYIFSHIFNNSQLYSLLLVCFVIIVCVFDCLPNNMVQTKEKIIKNSTFKRNMSLSSNDATLLWKNSDCGSGSMSSIEEIFNPVEIKEIVESLVMTKYSERFFKSISRRSKRMNNTNSPQISKESSELSISTCGISGLISSDGQSHVIEQYFPRRYLNTYMTPVEVTNTELTSEETLLEAELDNHNSFSHSSDINQQESLNLRLSTLKENKKQLIKAINYHEITKSTITMDRERLEAEKLLLITDITASLISFPHEDLSSLNSFSSFCSGTVELSGIHLFPTKECDQNVYFLCLLVYGSEVYASRISKIKSNGVIYFDDKFRISSLPPNFKLNLKIYSVSPKKFKKSTKPQVVCNYISNKPEDNGAFRESLFSLWGEFDVKLHHLSKSGVLKVRLSSGSFTASLLSCPQINVMLAGFLNVCSKYPFWDRQWCTLNGTCLKFFNDPSAELYDRTPMDAIDLMDSAKFKVTSREECARKYTLLIKTTEKSVLLSWESKNQFECWLKYLQLVVSEISLWGRC